jgi:hypothetical protein
MGGILVDTGATFPSLKVLGGGARSPQKVFRAGSVGQENHYIDSSVCLMERPLSAIVLNTGIWRARGAAVRQCRGFFVGRAGGAGQVLGR